MKPITRKVFTVLCTLVLMSGLAACSSSGSGGDDTADDTTFTATDAHNVGASFNNAQNAAYGDIMDEYATQLANVYKDMVVDATKASQSGVININNVYNCFVAGHITSIGDFNWTINYPVPPSDNTPYSFTIGGQLTENISDPTNNLNDCEVGGGVILDGSIYSMLTMSGNESGGQAKWTTDGIIGINRRGSSGGLVMIDDDCRIFLTIDMSWSGSGAATGSAYGTVCDESYNFTF